MNLHLVGGLGRNARAVLDYLVLHALRGDLHRGIHDVLGEERGLFVKRLLRGGLLVGFLLLLHLKEQVLQGSFRSGIRQEHLAARIHLVLDGLDDDIELEGHADIRDSLAQVHAERIAVAVDRAVQGNRLLGHGSRGRGRSGSRFRLGDSVLVTAAGNHCCAGDGGKGKMGKLHKKPRLSYGQGHF